MRYQVSDESEVGLKCLPLVEKPIPGRGARPFLYRSREGPGYKREREKKKKEKKPTERVLGAAPPSFLVGVPWYCRC
jgi:hypothetical protein